MQYSTKQIKKINSITTDFYNLFAGSFSETRQHEWQGWNNCLSYVKNNYKILDLACGNCRFEKFLNDNNILFNIDNYDCYKWNSSVKYIDIIQELIDDKMNLKSYDLAVCFGLFHHIPSKKLRIKLLEQLSRSKISIVSFWQFANDNRILNNAIKTTKIAKEKFNLLNLEENDYFLGWQNNDNAFRFCHNFTPDDIKIINQKFNVIKEFDADGKNNCLNKYLIIKGIK